MPVLKSSETVDETEASTVEMPAPSANPSIEAVRAQLNRILASPSFSRSERLNRFLRFIVDEKIADRTMELKEYTIATQVYERSASFDPTTDTIVRVEARRLRTTLEKYYSGQGQTDPVWIAVPKGGYEPLFGWKTSRAFERPAPAGPWPIAVLPFEDFGADRDQDSFCNGITEEIIHSLAQLEGVCVVARTSSFAYKAQHHDIRAIGETLDVRSVIEGSVRKQGDRLRITAQLINIPSGYHLWSKRFDRETKDVFATQDEIARAVADALRDFLGSRRSRGR